MLVVDAGRLHDAAVDGEVAVQHGQAAVLARRRARRRGCTPFSRSRSSVVPAAVLAEGDLGRHAAGRGAEELAHRLARRCARCPSARAPRASVARMHGRQRRVSIRPARSSSPRMRHDAAGAMHVLHVHVGTGRRDLAQHRHAARQPVDVVHGEVGTSPSWAAASRCSTVLVEPPMAMSSVMAFSNALKLAMARGSTLASSCS